MRVGVFKNNEKLKGVELLYNPKTSSFSIDTPEIKQDLSNHQVIKLHEQGFIQWDDDKMIKSLLSGQNNVAEDPLKGINLPEKEEKKIQAVPQSDKKKSIAFFVLMIIGLFLCLGVSLVVKNITFPEKKISAVEQQKITASDNLNSSIDKIKEKKSYEEYKKIVNHEKVRESLREGFIKVYLEKYPETSSDTLTTMRTLYDNKYDEMIKEAVEQGETKGTVLDGKLISTEDSDGYDIYTIENLYGNQIKLKIKTNKDNIYIEDVLNAYEFNVFLVDGKKD
jgi:hypothetical protein